MSDPVARTPEADVLAVGETERQTPGESLIPGYVLERHLRVSFTAEEATLMREFEDDWRKAPTYADRRVIFRTQVLEKMFKHRTNNGANPMSQEEAIHYAEKIRYYLNNTFCRRGVVSRRWAYKVKLPDVAKRELSGRIFQKINEMHHDDGGVGDLAPGHPRTITYYSRAYKKVMDGLSNEELQVLEGKVHEYNERGIPEAMQRRLVNAGRIGQEIKEFMTAMWRGMSAVGVLIMHFPDPDSNGYLTQMFDYNKEIVKLDISTLRETYRRETSEVISLLSTHARSIRAAVPGGPPLPPTNLKLPDALPKSRSGFPKIPPLVLSSRKAPDVRDLRRVFKLFLSAHYYLATGGRTWHVPWKDLADEACAIRFIEPEYLPEGFIFKAQVSHFTRQQLEDALTFWRHRQTTLGAANTFRFSQVKGKASGPSGRTADTQYPDNEYSVSGDGGSRMAEDTASGRETTPPLPPRTGGDAGNTLAGLRDPDDGRHLVRFAEKAPHSDVDMRPPLPGRVSNREPSRPRPAPLSVQKRHAARVQSHGKHRSLSATQTHESRRQPSSSQKDKQKTKWVKRKASQARFEELSAESSDEQSSKERPTIMVGRGAKSKGKGKQREVVDHSDDDDDEIQIPQHNPGPSKPKPKPRPRPPPSLSKDRSEQGNGLGRPDQRRLRQGEPGYYAQLNRIGK